MFRFIHTGDWQIGMRAVGLGAAAETVRAARIAALKNVFAVAADWSADAVLVAGDLFEDNQVSAAAVEQVAAVLNDATACPIYLLPGNHDPFTFNSVWTRDVWKTLRAHVRPLTTTMPVTLAAGVTLFPCPLTAKHGTADPTAALPPRIAGAAGDDGGLRIGLAHGTMKLRPDVGDNDFPMPTDAAERAGLDYLALGHWHSTLGSDSGRTWYSGTHETTKFGERDSGNVLKVTLTAAGERPHVEAARTRTLTWAEEAVDFDAEPTDAVLRRLREWPQSESQLLRMNVTGQVSPVAAAAVTQVRDVLAARFLYGQCDARLRGGDPAAALADLAGSPYLIAAADELRAAAESSPAAARALDLLYACAWDAREH